MPTELRLPHLADTVTSAKLGVWLKREGEAVVAGEALVEVETDKTNVEIEAPASGVLQEIHVPAGTDGLETGTLLAVIADDGDAHAAAEPEAADGASPPPDEAVPERRASPALAAGDAEPDAAPAAASSPGPAASPLARRMAVAAGLDLGQIKGTGRGGRISKSDVERVLAAQAPRAVAQPVATRAPRVAELPPAAAPAGFREEPLSAMRRVTAERLQAAKQTIPHFYLSVDCSMDAALQLRAAVNAHDPDLKLTVTAIVVRAAALALRQVPAANSAWTGNGVRLYDTADIAVAVDTPTGLITPIIRQVDRKGLRAISQELKTLSARAREGALSPEEYTGGTFTVSNLGMYGVDSLYAIVNPPQSCILGVGAAWRRPIAKGNGVEVGTIATCTLSADHRAIDGVAGAKLLGALRTFIEEPALLAL